MNKSPFAASVLGALTLLLACSSPAQDDRATMSDVFLVLPKSGMTAQFEEALRAHIAYRQDSGETRAWEAYTVALGTYPRVYQFRSGGMDWADFDAGVAEDAEKGLGAHWAANVDQYVEEFRHYIEVSDYDNSYWPEDIGQHRYYGVTSWSINESAGPAPYEARVELSRIGLEEGWTDTDGYWMWLSRIGGSPRLMIVSPYDSFADMAPPEQEYYEYVVEKVGQAEADRLFSTFSEGYTSSSFTVWAHRPDLSVSAAGGN